MGYGASAKTLVGPKFPIPLSALWDCAFDASLISFAEDGTVLRSPVLSEAGRAAHSR